MHERWGIAPLHGGTDGGPEPRFDFSSNANALGPNPFILKSLRQADPSSYPDPNYTVVRRLLAEAHGIDPGQVAVGAGASELILRLARRSELRRPVLIFLPTFSEYARTARIEGLPVFVARSAEDFLEHLPRSGLAFLCVPNNPSGEIYPFLDLAAEIAAESGVSLVLDLAYLPLSERSYVPKASVWRLYAPNKAHGLTGVRAGYLLAPRDLAPFRHLASSWVLSVFGETFLRASLRPEAQAWLARTRGVLWAWRRELAQGLRELGLEVREGEANFLLVRVPGSVAISRKLRARGIRVREAGSLGLSGWLRLSAQSPEARGALLSVLSEVGLG